MMNVIIELLGLGYAAGGFKLDQLKKIHARLAAFFVAAIALVLLEVGFNLIGALPVNLIILLIGSLVLLIALSRPEIILIYLGIYTGLGAARGSLVSQNFQSAAQGASQGFEKGWDKYIHAVVEILLWITTISLFLGIIPIRGRGWAALVIVCAIIVIKLASHQLHRPPVFYKVAQRYGYVVLVIGIACAIPWGSLFSTFEETIKKVGGYGKSIATTSPTKSVGASSSRFSKVDQVEGKQIWFVKYYPDQDPGWIGPDLPQGNYVIMLRGDSEGIRGMKYRINGKEGKIREEQLIYLSSPSSLQFISEKGGETRITIQRIG